MRFKIGFGLLSSGILTACGGAPTASMHVLLTSNGTSTSNLSLEVAQVEVHHKGADQWMVLGRPERKVELEKIKNGATDDLASATLPAGQVDRVRVVMRGGEIRREDGSSSAVSIAKGREQGVEIETEIEVADDRSTDVVVDVSASVSEDASGSSVDPAMTVSHQEDRARSETETETEHAAEVENETEHAAGDDSTTAPAATADSRGQPGADDPAGTTSNAGSSSSNAGSSSSSAGSSGAGSTSAGAPAGADDNNNNRHGGR